MQDMVVSAAEATGREIDLAVRELIEAGDACARESLEKRRADLEAGVELLIARESLTTDQFAPLALLRRRHQGSWRPKKVEPSISKQRSGFP
jgi:ATP-dependent Zn protease